MNGKLRPRIAACALVAALGTPALSSGADAPAASPGPTLVQALKAAQVAVEACLKIDQRIGVSVVDASGTPKVVLAADGTSARGVQSSLAKAATALAFDLPSGEVGERAKSDTALAARLESSTTYNSRAGGLPLRIGGVLVGAIGVGGARGSEKDEACAAAGLKAVESSLP